MKLETIQDFILLSKCINNGIVYDVAKRMMDWIGSGGKEDDPYIKQQLDYVNKIFNLANKEVNLKRLSELAKKAKEDSIYSQIR